MRLPSTLMDVPGLEALDEVRREFGVELTAFGGFVRRCVAASLDGQTVKAPADEVILFGLVPFISDIDLIHSGDKELTPKIYKALQTAIPYAECFRWELRSKEENAVFAQARLYNAVIPANLMSLSTESRRGLVDRWGGQRDIQDRKFRYIRNGNYSDSPLFQARRDLEFFSALLYFRVLLEARLGRERWKGQPGWADALRVVADANSTATVIALQESAYLRARLRYLLKALAVATDSDEDLEAVATETGLRQLLRNVDHYFYENGSSSVSYAGSFGVELVSDRLRFLCSVASARIGGDIFRLPAWSNRWHSMKDAEERLRALRPYRQAPSPSEKASSDDAVVNQEIELMEGQRVLLASPLMLLQAGQAPSSRPILSSDQSNNETNNVNFTVEPADEFIHFAMALTGDIADEIRKQGDEDLGVVMVFTGQQGEGSTSVLLPLTSACGYRFWGDPSRILLTMRINCGAFAEIAPELFPESRSLQTEGHNPFENEVQVGLQCFVLQYFRDSD